MQVYLDRNLLKRVAHPSQNSDRICPKSVLGRFAKKQFSAEWLYYYVREVSPKTMINRLKGGMQFIF